MRSRRALLALVGQLQGPGERIKAAETAILAWHRDEANRRVAAVPGIGPITASAIAATVADPAQFSSGRISKQGDGYLRRLLVVGATAVIRHAWTRNAAEAGCLRCLLERRPVRLASVALANKTARIAWAVRARGETYRAPGMDVGTRHGGLTRTAPRRARPTRLRGADEVAMAMMT